MWLPRRRPPVGRGLPGPRAAVPRTAAAVRSLRPDGPRPSLRSAISAPSARRDPLHRPPRRPSVLATFMRILGGPQVAGLVSVLDRCISPCSFGPDTSLGVPGVADRSGVAGRLQRAAGYWCGERVWAAAHRWSGKKRCAPGASCATAPAATRSSSSAPSGARRPTSRRVARRAPSASASNLAQTTARVHLRLV